MTSHFRRKTVMVSFLVQVLFIFMCVVPLYALAFEQKAAPAAIAPPPIFKPDSIQIIKKQMIMVPPKIAPSPLPGTQPPPGPIPRADLQCTITAYYDSAMTIPVQNNLWLLGGDSYSSNYSLPPYYPYVYWKIVVTNGNAPAQNFTVNHDFTISGQGHRYLNDVVSLGSYASVELHYMLGPLPKTIWRPVSLGSSVMEKYNPMSGKIDSLATKTDSTGIIVETNETNNNCSNWVKYVTSLPSNIPWPF